MELHISSNPSKNAAVLACRQSLWKFWHLALCFACLGLVTLCASFAAEGAATPKPTAVPVPAAPPATPYPRRILFPEMKAWWTLPPDLKLGETAPDSENEGEVLDFTQHRFTLVLGLASWNKRTEEILVMLDERATQMKARAVRFVALFPEETETTYREFVRRRSHPFLLGRVSPNSVAGTRDLEMPSAWVVNNRQEVLSRWANLTPAELDAILKKLALWTDF